MAEGNDVPVRQCACECPREKRSLCLVNVELSSGYVFSPEFLLMVLCLIGGRNSVYVCVCAQQQCGDILLSLIFVYHGALSNCTQEKADLQPHSTVLSFSSTSFKPPT